MSAAETSESATPDRAAARGWIGPVLFLIAWTVANFAAAAWMRAAYFGCIPFDLAGWTTAGSTLFAAQWYHEGPLHLRFGMYWLPASVEQPLLEMRPPYMSFLPGSIGLLYAVACIAGREPSPEMAILLNLALHAFTALMLGRAALRLGSGLGAGPVAAALMAAATSAAYVWLPSPYFEHQMGYFADPVAMFLFALFLWMETHRCAALHSARRMWGIAQSICLVAGFLNEWIFAFIAFTALLTRLADGTFGKFGLRALTRAFFFGLPITIVTGLFLFQLWLLGGFATTGARFFLRSGAQARAQGDSAIAGFIRSMIETRFSGLFWRSHISFGYGPLGAELIAMCGILTVLALLIALAFRIARRGMPAGLQAAVSVFLLAMLPCMIYDTVFHGHHNDFFHRFTALKFAVPLSLFAGGVGFVLPLAVITRRYPAARPLHLLIAIASLGATGAYLVQLAPQRAKNLDSLGCGTAIPAAAFGPLLRAHTGYNDVVFSPEFTVDPTPPQISVHTMRVVHRAETIEEIAPILANISEDYTVCILTEDAIMPCDIERLIDEATEHHHENGFDLWKIPRARFMEMAAAQ